MRTVRGYTERHSRSTLFTCLLFLFIVVGSGFYILDYGLHNHDDETTEVTSFEVSIELYSSEVNVSGDVAIYFLNGSLFLNVTADSDGNVVGLENHQSGVYRLYYNGFDNSINFGPVEYTVLSQDKLLVDRDFVGIRVTIQTL